LYYTESNCKFLPTKEARVDEKKREAVIREIAEKHLDEQGKSAIEELLLDSNLMRAELYILGAIDVLFVRKKISDEEATTAIKQLGIDPHRAARVHASGNGS